ncbi:MAG: response regulator transcription factor [Pseudomonadota bacterium]
MSVAPSVLIVDDHPLFRDALETALHTAFPGDASANHAESVSAAMDLLAQCAFDLVLLDLQMSDSQGFSGLSQIRSIENKIPVVIVSATETDTAFRTARELGASGYLPKSMSLSDLSAALVTILDGGEWFPESDITVQNHANELVSTLTPTQLRVLTGLSEGLLNKQIAYDMGISIATVKAHMTAIFRKLGANNRTQALLVYREAIEIGSHSAA